MSRIISTEGGTKERTRLSKAVVKAIRILAQQEKPDDDSRDMAAFIAMALELIYKSVEVSVVAWERRITGSRQTASVWNGNGATVHRLPCAKRY